MGQSFRSVICDVVVWANLNRTLSRNHFTATLKMGWNNNNPYFFSTENILAIHAPAIAWNSKEYFNWMSIFGAPLMGFCKFKLRKTNTITRGLQAELFIRRLNWIYVYINCTTNCVHKSEPTNHVPRVREKRERWKRERPDGRWCSANSDINHFIAATHSLFTSPSYFIDRLRLVWQLQRRPCKSKRSIHRIEGGLPQWLNSMHLIHISLTVNRIFIYFMFEWVDVAWIMSICWIRYAKCRTVPVHFQLCI